jgi:hypothetical protein
VIGVTESAKFRLFRVPVEGGPEQEIVTDGSMPLMGGPGEDRCHLSGTRKEGGKPQRRRPLKMLTIGAENDWNYG